MTAVDVCRAMADKGSMATGLADPQVLGRSIAALLSASAALPRRELLGAELDPVNQAAARGYFLPDEEELIRERYSHYLALRASYRWFSFLRRHRSA